MGEHAHPEVSMHTHSLAEYEACLRRNDTEGIGELMLSSSRKLESIGAQVLLCPDNTIHRAFAYVADRSTAHWLHIAEVVAAAAADRRFRRLGILGTQWLVDSDVYPDALRARSLEFVRPFLEDCAVVNRILMNELVAGVQRPESVTALQGVIARLRNRGCDAVVLGCTELPLVLGDHNSPLPTLDSTRLLARAAVRAALI